MTVAKIIKRTSSGENVRVFRPDPKFLLPTFHRLKLTLKDGSTYIVNMGGGGSSKSYSQAQFFVELLLKEKHKLMVIRKTGESLADSVIAEFTEHALNFWGLTEGVDYTYNKTSRKIRFIISKSEIIFKGLDNPEKFKSIPGVTLVWFEEVSEITENDFDIVNDRIRGEPKIYMTFNPISEQHWIKRKFIDQYKFDLDMSGQCPGCYRTKKTEIGVVTVLFSTFRENPFIGQKYINSMRGYRLHNPDHYRVYGLGLWGIIRPDMPYFNSWESDKHATEGIDFDPARPIYLSVDFNVKNTFLISQREPRKWVKYIELMHGTGDLKQMCTQIVNKFGRFRTYYFTGDASGNNRSATSDGNRAAWQLINHYFLELGVMKNFLHFGAVPTSNGSTAESRMIANMVISYYGENLKMNKKACAILHDDIARMEALPDGSLNKVKCNKDNYGHAGDTFRYDLKNFEGVHVKAAFAELERKMLTSGNRNNI